MEGLGLTCVETVRIIYRLAVLSNLLFLFSLQAQSKTLKVCSASCDYTQVQPAIDAAQAEDLVQVASGIYSQGPLLISKTIQLEGEKGAILDGSKQYQVITIQNADNVIVRGFTIQNTGMSYTAELAGVRVIKSKKCLIEGNTFLNTTYGAYLENSEECKVSGNTFVGDAKDEVTGGNGVHVWYGAKHLIEKNEVSGHRDGIYFEFSKGTKAYDNTVHHNVRYGLHFMFSSQTEYFRNFFSENGAGVAVMYSREIKMYQNKFVGNTGPAAYGLLMKEVQNSELFENEFSNNTVGIFMEGSNRSRFRENRIADNGWGLRIMGDCEQNEFLHNNFIGNTFEVTTNADHSWNIFSENYWSQYQGYDLDHNGFGDKPYRPVSLSSVILERVDASYILMNSFFFSLIDDVERALPTLIPEPLKDETPLMKPYISTSDHSYNSKGMPVSPAKETR